MVRINSTEDKNLIERELCELFPPEWLREKARETGLIKRERKIDPVTRIRKAGSISHDLGEELEF